MSYTAFLESKRHNSVMTGFDIDESDLNDKLYPFQKHCVQWALKRGRAALFEDCGLGKTPQQLEWAHRVSEYTDKPVLILAPLAVSEQTAREGKKFGIEVNVCRSQDGIRPGVNVTNYHMLHHFTPEYFGGVVLDESSILKNYDGHYRKMLTSFVSEMQFRLSATATPAPNDLIEIINQSDFLSILSGKEAIALYFIQDGNTTHAWRLKGHAERPFYQWLSSWSIAMRSPADLGYCDKHFKLPKLNTIQHVVDGTVTDGFLFAIEAQTLQDRRAARKESIGKRAGLCAELVNQSDRPWIVWCNLNSESEELARLIPDAVEVKGSDDNDHKRDALIGFSEGRYRVMVTKPSIAGHGLNWQHCSDMAFVGLSDSWEQYYQAVRRCWRFGQKREVNAHVVISEKEGAVLANIQRKEAQAEAMMENIVSAMEEGRHALVG